jgi:hypothetical protein
MSTDLEAVTRYVGHVRQAALAATEERQRLVRYFVLALAEVELTRLEREEGATMEGKLFSNNAGQSLQDTAIEAAQAFYEVPKLRGLVAVECQVHPKQVNELPPIVKFNIAGGNQVSLPVVGSVRIQRGCVYVCGEKPLPGSLA